MVIVAFTSDAANEFAGVGVRAYVYMRKFAAAAAQC